MHGRQRDDAGRGEGRKKVTPEESVVYALAFELRKTPEEIRNVDTIDFLRLADELQARWNRPSKADWYAAQVAYWQFAIPFMVWGKKVPQSFKVESFLLKFKEPEAPPEEVDEETRAKADAMYVELQKTYWLVGLGLDPVTGKPQDDGIPVQTRLPPDMSPPGQDFAVNDAVDAAPPLPPRPAAPRGAGWTPTGRGKRRK